MLASYGEGRRLGQRGLRLPEDNANNHPQKNMETDGNWIGPYTNS